MCSHILYNPFPRRKNTAWNTPNHWFRSGRAQGRANRDGEEEEKKKETKTSDDEMFWFQLKMKKLPLSTYLIIFAAGSERSVHFSTSDCCW